MYIKLDKKENIARLTIAREKSLNALSSELLQELSEVLDVIDKDEEIYCLIVTGEGEKSFVAGADISEMQKMDKNSASIYGQNGNAVFKQLEDLKVPTIAAVNGYALGGGLELALACDIRIASDNAVFAMPETSLGIIPGFGGTQRLARFIGISQAKRLIYSGEKINAEKALLLGLVSEVTLQSELIQTAESLAEKIAKNAPIAVKKAKKMINLSHDLCLDEGLKIETESFSDCFLSEDQKNAMEAFVRREKFTGFLNR